MTKPQIWVASFLVLFIILFIIGRLTKEEEQFKPVTNSNMPEQNTSENLSAEDLISSFGCVNCHGQDLNGTSQGPALVQISQKFSREELIAYLRNPNSFQSGKRFQEYRKQYPNVIMPNFGNKDVKSLGKITDYLLKR